MSSNSLLSLDNLNLIVENSFQTFDLDTIKSIETDVKELESTVMNNFGRSMSGFMDTMFNMSEETPLRSARNALAEIDSKFKALKDHYFDIKNKLIDIEEIDHILESTDNKFEIKRLNLKKSILSDDISYKMKFIEGAYKGIKVYLDNYNNLLSFNGKTDFSEEEFEKQEVIYHIKTALKKSARSIRFSGRIDSSIQEYLENLGINPSYAEKTLNKVLSEDTSKGLDVINNKIDILSKEFIDLSFKKASSLGLSISPNLSAVRRIEK